MIFKSLFDSKFEKLIDELGVTKFNDCFSVQELFTIRNDGRVGMGSKPEEAAARTFRDLILLNQRIPIDNRLEAAFSKVQRLKLWCSDDKVNVDLYFSIKDALEHLLHTYVGDEYEQEYYEAVFKTGVISPISHDTLRFIAHAYLYGGKKWGTHPVAVAQRLFSDVIMNDKHTYGPCVVGGQKTLDSFSSSMSQAIFVLHDKKLIPYKFGDAVVTLSAHSSGKAVDFILNQAKDRPIGISIFTRMKSRPRIAQFEILAAHLATYHVYAQAVLQAPREIMAEVYKGASDGLGAWLAEDPPLAAYIEKHCHEYATALTGELQTSAEDSGFSIGSPVARLITTRINENYAHHFEFKDKPLEISGLDDSLIVLLIQTGILAQMKALRSVGIEFRSAVSSAANSGTNDHAEVASQGGGFSGSSGDPESPTNSIPGSRPLILGDKILFSIFAIVIFMGILKAIFWY